MSAGSVSAPSSLHRYRAAELATRSIRVSSRTHRCRSTPSAARPATTRTWLSAATRWVRNVTRSSSSALAGPLAGSGNSASARSPRWMACSAACDELVHQGVGLDERQQRVGVVPDRCGERAAGHVIEGAEDGECPARAPDPAAGPPPAAFTAGRSARDRRRGASPRAVTRSAAPAVHSARSSRDSVTTLAASKPRRRRRCARSRSSPPGRPGRPGSPTWPPG